MIEKNINEALVKQEPSARTLITYFFNIDKENDLKKVSLYHQFPLYLDETGEKSITTDLLFISQKYGIIIFKCIEFSERLSLEADAIIQSLDKLDRLLYARILKDATSLFLGRREFKVQIAPVIFLNNCSTKPNIDSWKGFEIITSQIELSNLIIRNFKTELSDFEYKDLKATIEGSKGIIKINERAVKDINDLTNSKGAILTTIENDIYNFDLEQKRAALFTLDGAQRIRGLAGSGKTVILAMKAALIHLQNKDAEILYTYYTKSLYDLVKRLITRFYRQFAERDPNWDKIHIMHAWGGRGLEGVYYNACHYNNITPMALQEAKFKSSHDPFDYVCEQLNQYKLKKQYNYAILDEAQDFPPHFYRVCRQLTEKNRVIWAYDDFQNILDIKIQDEKDTFGKDAEGQFYIDFSRKDDELQDLILYKCYRNPKKILLSAFALGLGIYNKNIKSNKSKILQRLENNEQWQDLGFLVEKGNSNVGDEMIISRSDDNSASNKNHYLNDDSIVRMFYYNEFIDECKAVAEMIIEDIKKELRPEDINVIALDNRNVKSYFTNISSLLRANGIKVFSLLEAPTDNTIFKVKEHVTLSTIYKAKGNEAGSVYIVGVDAIFNDKDNIIERNKIFTAMTRSLAWVTLTGIGESVKICHEELVKLKTNDYKLIFTQPSEKEVNTIRQSISQRQRKLNEIERLKQQLIKLGMTEEEIVQKHLIQPKK